MSGCCIIKQDLLFLGCPVGVSMVGFCCGLMCFWDLGSGRLEKRDWVWDRVVRLNSGSAAVDTSDNNISHSLPLIWFWWKWNKTVFSSIWPLLFTNRTKATLSIQINYLLIQSISSSTQWTTDYTLSNNTTNNCNHKSKYNDLKGLPLQRMLSW